MSKTQNETFVSADYRALEAKLKKSALLNSANGVLTWDMETYMPAKACESRSEQQALLSELAHKETTSSSYRSRLQALIDIDTGAIQDPRLPIAIQDSLKVLRRDFLQQSKLPSSFIKQFSAVTSKAFHAWTSAKKQNSFQIFLPHLQKVIDLCRKKADLLGYEEHPYDALIDIYEPEMTSKRLTPIFTQLQQGLKKLLASIPSVDTSCLQGQFPRQTQLALAQEILQLVGLHADLSRLDESVHPFCISFHPNDVRLTTKVLEDNVMSSIGSVLHEAGHGLYESNLAAEHFGTPLGQPCSLAIHESQSRFFEVFLGKSLPFWGYFYPRLQKAFASQFAHVSFEKFYKAIHEVKPSLIRIESDEVTYNLHIIVRFECEKALIEGSLQPQEIPEFWNQKIQDYLGIRPSSFADGCLQDVHWSMGGFGYFPTYTLGNLAAASLFNQFQKEHPSWQSTVAQGNLDIICEFLRNKIHCHGRRFASHQLMNQATGSSFNPNDFLSYLQQKYKALEHL